jgi:hypothetical protein
MEVVHKKSAGGKWFELSLCEQLGNIGSEIHRALRWRDKDHNNFEAAVDRTLELFELTLKDKRWQKRLREIARARELFCDAIGGGKEYKTSLQDLDRYFFHYAFCARRNI